MPEEIAAAETVGGSGYAGKAGPAHSLLHFTCPNRKPNDGRNESATYCCYLVGHLAI